MSVAASSGRITAFDLPSGPGVRERSFRTELSVHSGPPLTHIAVPQVRVDCTGYVGYSPNPSFDPLIAKIIAHAVDWRDAVQVLRRALAEVHIAGVSSNVGFLQALAATREFEANDVTTTFIEENMLRLCDPRAPGVQSDLRAPASYPPSGAACRVSLLQFRVHLLPVLACAFPNYFRFVFNVLVLTRDVGTSDAFSKA
jgi:acetyl/propionyl-CoA carboxylase alpha subunit